MTTATQSLTDVLHGQWLDLGRKVAQLGEALPAAAWKKAPADGVRTPLEVFRHLAFWNRWLAASARGGDPDGAANEIPTSEAPGRAEALAAFEKSVGEAAEALASRGTKLDPETAGLYASFLGHTSEHYGQLVVYARLDGVVPPASR
jgi:hypothetical protein